MSVSCSNENKIKDKKSVHNVNGNSKAKLLINKLSENTHFVNSIKMPALISAEDVNQLLDSNILIIDLRGAKAFSNGHIKGAFTLKYKELLDYFKVSGTPDYKKVVLVCYTGQSASYAASTLQMLGYNNVYAMNLGMCAWNSKFSKKRVKNSTDRLISKLETKSNPKNNKGVLVEFKCKSKSGTEILKERVKLILKEGFKEGAVTIDDIISDPGDYYIINIWNDEKYNIGHLKTAVQYNPETSLTFKTNLLTLPKDKTVVIYGSDGQHSAYIVSYLRVLGYNAKTLKYGANGFMNKLMLENEKLGNGFDEKLINNFKTKTSIYIEEKGGIEEGGC